MQLSINVVSGSNSVTNGFPSCVGEIRIGDFSEYFTITLDFWTIEEYVQQWSQGIVRLDSFDTSCLITTMRDPRCSPLLNWWVMYKDAGRVIVRNQLLCGENYLKRIGYRVVTLESCYDFVMPRTTIFPADYAPSEWIVRI